MPPFSLFGRRKEPAKVNTGKTFDAAAIIGIPSSFDLKNIAMGQQETVVMPIECGGCGKQWKDALVPNIENLVTCPFCGGINRAALNAQVIFVK
jgi:hypothetical protein